MKKYLPLLLTALLTMLPGAAQTYLDFADADSSASLSAFFYIDGAETNYISDPASGSLINGESVSFDGAVVPVAFPLNISIFDDGYTTDNSLGYQVSFSLTNNTGADQPVSNGSLEFGLTGLFAIEPGLTLTSDFSFVSGNSTITDQMLTSYDSGTGTYTFTNDQGFTITNGQTLSFTGNFSAVPEPSTYGVMLGFGALALVAGRRRRSAA